jgi:hypothetical protein
MAELHSEIEQARRLLRGVMPSPGARERIYAQIVAPRPLVRHRLLSPALVAATVLVASGAAAVSLVIVDWPAVFRMSENVPDAAPNARNTPKRTVGRVGRHRSDAQPATPTAPTSSATPPTAASSEQEPATAPSRQAPARVGADRSSSHEAESPPRSSELAQQVKAYRKAVALIRDEPSRALGELRAFRSQWPTSALSHEVDLRIVQTLVALRDSAEAGREAEVFLARHPDSPRTAEMQALVEAERRADAGSN